MVNTSARPVTVDGVRLDTLAWNVDTITLSTSARTASDYDVPNMDGTIPSLNDPLEAGTFGLSMWLRGTDADGAVPAVGSQTQLRNNLDELLHLFGQRHKLLEIRQTVDGAGTERRAWGKVTDVIAPELNTPGSAGTFSVAFVLPYGVWEDVATQDWTKTGAGFASAEVTTLTGATERLNDAIFLVQGPATTPRITDPSTGMWIELGAALSSTQFWRFNSATWSSRYGTGLGLGSADTTGTDGRSITNVGGPSRAYGLPLTPVRDTAARRTRVTLSAASGLTAASALSIRAARKFSA